MLMITAFIAMLKGYWPDGDLPYFAEPQVGAATVATLQEPESVTVQVVYPSSDPDLTIGQNTLRTVGDPRPVYHKRWTAAWKTVAKMTVREAGIRYLCKFHPDRLIVLRRGEHEVKMLTCHSCREFHVFSQDIEGKLMAPLVPAIDHTFLDLALPTEWVDQAVLEEGLGREILPIVRSAKSVRGVWMDASNQATADTKTAQMALNAGAKTVSPALVEGLLISAAAAARRVRIFGPNSDLPFREDGQRWGLWLEVTGSDGRRARLVLFGRGDHNGVLAPVRDQPQRGDSFLQLAEGDAYRLLLAVGMKPPGP